MKFALITILLFISACSSYQGPRSDQYDDRKHLSKESGVWEMKPHNLTLDEYIKLGPSKKSVEEMMAYSYMTSNESYQRNFELDRKPHLSNFMQNGKVINEKNSGMNWGFASSGVAGELASKIGFWLVLETRKRWFDQAVKGKLPVKYHWKAKDFGHKDNINIWAPAEVMQTIRVDDPELDIAFYNHFFGLHNKQVGRKLMQGLSSESLFSGTYGMELFVAFSSTTLLLKDSRDLPTVPLFEQYYQAQFSEHLLESIYGLHSLEKYYQTTRFAESTTMRNKYLTNSYNSNLPRVKAKCLMDNNITQLTMFSQTRVQFDCFWHPKSTTDELDTMLNEIYFDHQVNNRGKYVPKDNDIATTRNATRSIKTSYNTYYSMDTKELIPRTWPAAGFYNGYTAMKFNDNWQSGKSKNEEAMEIAKELPSFALTAWIGRDEERKAIGYVYHHGILWEYDLSALLPFEEINVQKRMYEHLKPHDAS